MKEFEGNGALRIHVIRLLFPQRMGATINAVNELPTKLINRQIPQREICI